MFTTCYVVLQTRYLYIHLKLNSRYIEKRVISIILTLLGVIGLVMAGINFIAHGAGSGFNISALVVYGLVGLLFFFAGIGLIRSTKDIAKNNGHIG